MRKLRQLLAILAIASATACANGYSAAAPSPTPAPTPDPAPASGATAVSIPIGAEALANRAFVPDEVEIAVGGTVTWTNNDRVSHTTTSNGPGWDSGSIGPGQQFSKTYAAAGTFPYHCAIHPGMVGTVTVR